MDGKLFYKYAKACNNHGITIYPTCSNYGRHKIIVNENGREKVGADYYEHEASRRNVIVKTPTGDRTVIEIVPSLWDKIFELYQKLCEQHKFLNE